MTMHSQNLSPCLSVHWGNHTQVYLIHVWVFCLLTNHNSSQDILRWIITYPEGGRWLNRQPIILGMCVAGALDLPTADRINTVSPLQLPPQTFGTSSSLSFGLLLSPLNDLWLLNILSQEQYLPLRLWPLAYCCLANRVNSQSSFY